ncbi:MAG: thioredoxin family protein [Acidithiobacillus sp.]|uniref:thioredoxin family protein n=1 Tax=Acidithiobacillus sp. TaxID=1872118 RepID=UPI0025C52DF3|nr:thioredoxin family protein [Acidithiobacillus sp.]
MVQKVSELGFWQRMAESRGWLILFFSSAGCASCKHWRRLLSQYEQQRSDLVVWEVDAGIDMGLTREFEVYHLPALFLFRDGRYQRPVEVEARLPALDAWLRAREQWPAEELP